MAKEIEAKFININKSNLIKKLEALGAVKVFDERLLKRYLYSIPFQRNKALVRIRDEQDKITMSYKCMRSISLSGMEEVELIINDLEIAREFLAQVGLKEVGYRENKRMRYVLKDQKIEFDIDTWPGLNPLLEIESDSEEKVKWASKELGFVWSKVLYGTVGLVYTKVYNISEDWIINDCKLLTFENIPQELSESNKRK